MTLGNSFTYAFDDSGGIEPLLNKHREFFPGDHPFFLIVAIGINDDLLDDFRTEWQCLRRDIQLALNSPSLPALHARLMFGDRKPPTYRGEPNPYLAASREDVLGWYMRGLSIVGRYLRIKRGGDLLTSVYPREEGGRVWESIFRSAEAQGEGEFLKLVDRQRFPKLHQKYVAHVSAALTMPTLDAFMGIQETMRQCGATCTALLDGYSDADGFSDQTAFQFLNTHLDLSRFTAIHAVPDTDNEPLCQAADLIAYMMFRIQLAKHRQKPLEEGVQQAITLLKFQQLCSLDIPRWLLRQRKKGHVQAVFNAARYALAYHEIKKYAPEVVEKYFQTPNEFLEQCQEVLCRPDQAFPTTLYLPILKPGVLANWQATRSKDGEDRSKSGPVVED